MSGWRSSSHCNGGQCAEVSSWRKSSFCADRECVEAGGDGAVVGVRDTALGASSPVLAFGSAAWEAFTSSLKQQP